MNKVELMAMKIMDKNSEERKEAEKMMGRKLEDMTIEQRVLAAEVLSAFEGAWNK